MNNQFIQLTEFGSKKTFFINISNIVSVEPGGEEGNARVATCLNFSHYTIETVFQIMGMIGGLVPSYHNGSWVNTDFSCVEIVN